jgi:cell division protein ZapA
MGELSIKIKIGDREYPMRVDAAEEERIRKAGKLINERLKAYKNQFGIDDKQDLLAMVAFDCAVERMKAEENSSGTDHSVMEKITHLNNLISQAF